MWQKTNLKRHLSGIPIDLRKIIAQKRKRFYDMMLKRYVNFNLWCNLNVSKRFDL